MVYASRFEEKAADALPQTSVITSADILGSGASNVSEVLSKVMGLATRANLDGSTNAVIDMRGYGDTADNNVVILLDGVRISENEQASARTSMIPVEIIDHMEITYGGNSVLYGDGATGGTINIVTKKVVGEMTVVSGGLSSYAGYQASLFHTRELGNSQLSLFAKGLNSDGYRDNARTKERSAGFNWLTTLDATSSWGARFFTSQEDNSLPGPLPSVWLNTAPTSAEVPGYRYGNDGRSYSLTLFGQKKIDNVELLLDVSRRDRSNASSWRYNAKDVFTGYSPTLSPAPGYGGTAPVNTYSYGESSIKGNTQHFSPRIKVSDFVFANNQVVVGVDRALTARNLNANFTSAYDPDSMTQSTSEVHFRTQGFYVRDDWQLNPLDRVTLGYRTQNYSESNAGSSNWSSFGSASAYEAQYSRRINQATTGFVRSSQNFRLPNVDDNNSVNSDINWKPIRLVPQVSHDVDVGVSYQTSKMLSELRIFRSNIRNEIAFDPNANGGYGGNINYDPTQREGVNLRHSYQLARDWDVRVNLNHVNAVFTQNQYANNVVPNTARNTGVATLAHQLDRQQKISWTTRFASAKFASGDFLNNQAKIPGYLVHDLGYLYQQKNFSVSGSVHNIFNKQYTDLGIYKPYNSGDGYYYLSPYNMTVYPNPGRSFNLVGRYNF